ncbi:MAG: hypothetical protein ACJ796_02045 [Gemmatimonadaceae bacterium]
MTYAIVRGDVSAGFALVNTSVVFIPPALETPRQLQFVRTTLLDIMDEYAVTRAGLRVAEGLVRRNPFRLNLEGVVQELLASSQVELYVAGPIATIASLLGERDRKRIKRLIAGEEAPDFSAQWAQFSEEEREAILVAVSACRATPGAAKAFGLTNS